MVAVWVAIAFTLPASATWQNYVNHGFLIVTIVVATWLIAALIGYGLSLAVGRYETSVPDNATPKAAPV